MYLFLAVFTFLFGVGILVYEYLTGDYVLRRMKWGGSLFDGRFSVGWLFLLLSVYNMMRWWQRRSFRQTQRAARIAEMQRELRHRNEPHETPGEPDPSFDFTHEPPARDPRITDQPPSNT